MSGASCEADCSDGYDDDGDTLVDCDDPDCDFDGVPVRGCPRNKRFCSKAGVCSFIQTTDTNLIQLSEPCSKIYLEGETALIGYTGTEQDFNEASRDVTDADNLCAACPGDHLYEGIPQKGEDNE